MASPNEKRPDLNLDVNHIASNHFFKQSDPKPTSDNPQPTHSQQPRRRWLWMALGVFMLSTAVLAVVLALDFLNKEKQHQTPQTPHAASTLAKAYDDDDSYAEPPPRFLLEATEEVGEGVAVEVEEEGDKQVLAQGEVAVVPVVLPCKKTDLELLIVPVPCQVITTVPQPTPRGTPMLVLETTPPPTRAPTRAPTPVLVKPVTKKTLLKQVAIDKIKYHQSIKADQGKTPFQNPFIHQGMPPQPHHHRALGEEEEQEQEQEEEVASPASFVEDDLSDKGQEDVVVTAQGEVEEESKEEEEGEYGADASVYSHGGGEKLSGDIITLAGPAAPNSNAYYFTKDGKTFYVHDETVYKVYKVKKAPACNNKDPNVKPYQDSSGEYIILEQEKTDMKADTKCFMKMEYFKMKPLIDEYLRYGRIKTQPYRRLEEEQEQQPDEAGKATLNKPSQRLRSST